jgi:hypothetical protein
MGRDFGGSRRGVLALGCLAATPAPAQPVNEDAAPAVIGELVFSQTAVRARDDAFAAARRAAWDRMLADAALPPRAVSPAQLERLVSSIVIEQERVTPTRYSGRLTVNFAPGTVRATLGPAASAGGAETAASAPMPGPGPTVASIDATALYAGLAEWLELRRRLQGTAAVANLQILGIAVDAARLRLALRQAPAEAAATLAGLGVALVPEPRQPNAWRVRLAGG